MKITLWGIVIVGWGCAYSAALADPAWRSVEKILGRPGTEQAGGFRIDFPRTDLNVTIEGIPLEPALAFTSRFYFKPLVKGTLLAGEVVLLDQEERQVTAQLKANGFQVSQAHGFQMDESPRIKTLHIVGRGSRVNLAMALNRVLSAAPLKEETSEKPQKTTIVLTSATEAPAAGKTKASPTEGDWERVEAILGPGKVEGKVLLYEDPFERNISEKGLEIPAWMGMETILRFQKVPGVLGQKNGFLNFFKMGKKPEKIAVVAGQLLLTPERAEAVEETLAANQVKVAFRYDLESTPRMVILYVGGLGPEEALAEGFKRVLDQIRLDQK